MKNQSDGNSRERILTAVRNAQRRTAVFSTSYDKDTIYVKPEQLLPVFKQEVEAVAGTCYVVANEVELYQQLAELVQERGWPYLYTFDTAIQDKIRLYGISFSNKEQDFREMPAAITPCEFLVARTGSVLMSSVPAQGRTLYAFAPVHVVIASESQLVEYPEDALHQLRQRYDNQLPSAFGFVTGPSRTADIEKTLVLGAHGPKELIIFVLKNKAN